VPRGEQEGVGALMGSFLKKTHLADTEGPKRWEGTKDKRRFSKGNRIPNALEMPTFKEGKKPDRATGEEPNGRITR
jgi:hypothetical protein